MTFDLTPEQQALAALRAEIDGIDDQILALFEQRLAIAATVGRAKDIVESLEGSDFRCGDRQGKENEHLAAKILQVFGKRDEINVGGVQHQFHAHEHDDCVTANEYTKSTNREQDGCKY